MLSSASSLVGSVYGYMRTDEVGGTRGTAQDVSSRNSLQLQQKQLPSYLFRVFCVCIVSEECSRCFMGSHEAKSQRRCQEFHDEDVPETWLVGLRLFRCGHQSCMGCRSGTPFHTKVARFSSLCDLCINSN